MSGAALLVAVAAAFGNLLQGWDNAAIAGAVLYIKREYNLENEPVMEGLVMGASLIGAAVITTCCGLIVDTLGRRPMLIISSLFYFVGGLVMLWSSNVYILLLGRLLDGFGIGLAVTVVPVYISETAPPEIRGSLNTLPQLTGSGGMFLSYCVVFGTSLMEAPSWRLMLGVLAIPSVLYFGLTILYLPESPRWLVSKGRTLEAKRVLQRLCGKEDVSGELALLVEGLAVGGDASFEEYIIGPADEYPVDQDILAEKNQIKLYGPEEGLTWVARPARGQSVLGVVSRGGSSTENHNVPLVDPLVTLFASVHAKLPEAGTTGSMLFPHFGSMFSVGGDQAGNQEWDEERQTGDAGDYPPEATDEDSDNDLQSPLISCQPTEVDRDLVSAAHGNPMQGNGGDPVGNTGIGGGWQLAWKWSEQEGDHRKKEGGFKRIYLHQEGTPASRRGSLFSLPGGDDPVDREFVPAAALVSQPALCTQETVDGPAMVHPSKTATQGPSWRDMFELGVKHALAVGIGIQILQQFSGINGVLYYTPQILEQAGVGILLSKMGISPTSTSLLISGITTLLMLPSIAVAMRLMDVVGRRTLLLSTIPVLIVALLVLILGSTMDFGKLANAGISTASAILYFCFFVLGFGPIPNILCAEIFPTRVRGLCIAICALAFWIGDIIVTCTLPVMLKSIGLAGVFGIYAVVCFVALVFVHLKVPETKGMPLEVIAEFFSVGAKQAIVAKAD